MYQESSLMAVLEDRGYRATAPRRAIAELLEQKHEGFTAEALNEELPSVGRATVFRTIKILLDAGVVCRIPKMDGAPVYSLALAGRHHHHSICVQCGAVGEFKAATIERALRAISADIDGQIIDHRIELYVTCNRCPSNGDR